MCWHTGTHTFEVKPKCFCDEFCTSCYGPEVSNGGTNSSGSEFQDTPSGKS